MATPGAAAEVKPGGANNPTGRNQYTAPVEPVVPSDGVEVNATNVSNDKEGKGTIHGNTSDYALRRLTKAAKGQKSHGVEVNLGNTKNDKADENTAPYVLRRLTRAAIESLLAQADQQTTPGAEGEVRPGGANNPYGCKGKPDEDGINHDNVMIDSKDPNANQGNSTDYALRRLTKAAKGQKSHGGEDGWGE